MNPHMRLLMMTTSISSGALFGTLEAASIKAAVIMKTNKPNILKVAAIKAAAIMKTNKPNILKVGAIKAAAIMRDNSGGSTVALLGHKLFPSDGCETGISLGTQPQTMYSGSDMNEGLSTWDFAGGSPLWNVSFSSRTDLWAAFEWYGGALNTDTALIFRDTGGNAVAELRSTNQEQWRLYTRSGGTLTQRGVSTDAGTNARFDLHLNINASGEFTLYKNGVSIITWSGDTTDGGSYTDCTDVDMEDFSGSTGSQISAFMVTDGDSRDYHAVQLSINAAGSNSDWAGAYTDIDENYYNFSDVLSTEIALDDATFAIGNLASPYTSGYDVMGLHVSAGVRNASGLARCQAICYSGTTFGVGTTFTPQAGGSTSENGSAFFTLDPNTAAAWTVSGIASAEVGVRAIAPV